MTDRGTRFEIWWRAFERRVAGMDSHEKASQLRRKLRRMRLADRPEFVRDLWGVLLRRDYEYGVALFLLDSLDDLDHLRELARRLTPLPGRLADDQESHLSDLIRVLAATNDSKLLPPVRAYLLERTITPWWPTVPWALWPHRRELFARAWSRYLAECEPASWRGSVTIRPFLAEPDAVRAIRRRIADEMPDRWAELRQALVGQAVHVRWLSDEQRGALERAVS